MAISTSYVQARDDNLYVSSSRVTLDSVIVPWLAGETPETIHADFPTVPLSDIYGAIADYLERQAEMDAWLREGDEPYERQCADQQATDPSFYARLQARLAAW